LIGALKDQDEEIRNTARDTLIRLGPESIPAITPLLTGKDQELRRAAIRILGAMDEGFTEAEIALNRHFMEEKVLAEALKDPDPAIRDKARITVKRLGKVAVPALVRMVEGKDRQLRLAATEFLGDMGGRAQDAVPALTGLFQEAEEKEVRRAALSAISRIVGPAGRGPRGPTVGPSAGPPRYGPNTSKGR
jgi:HEAT repeat protein